MIQMHDISLYAMAALYLLAGLGHFILPGFFLKIMPRWVPYPKHVNWIVGGIEIGLALALLIPDYRAKAAIGIMALLIAVFPANIRHYHLARKKGKNQLATLIRLPIQGLLIYWAYSFI